jgi:membrane protein required for beta-lactamase induction
MCVVVILIFVSTMLCCVPSRVCLYFVLLLVIFVVCICVPPFEQVFFHLRAVIDPLAVCRPHVGFHFAVEDLLLIFSLSFGLCICMLACELSFVLECFHLHFPYFV